MRLLDLKLNPRHPSAVTIQLRTRAPGRPMRNVTRDVPAGDVRLRQPLRRQITVECPPVLRISPGETIYRLPVSVKELQPIATLIDRRVLTIVKEYDYAPEVQESAAISTSEPRRRSRKG
jgi:hypothetical protein